MCLYLNKVTLSGDISRPQVRVTADGKSTVARCYLVQKNKEGETVGQFLLKFFGETAKRLEKEDPSAILVIGKLQTSTFADQGGKRVQMLEIVCGEYVTVKAGTYINQFQLSGRLVKDGDYYNPKQDKKGLYRNRIAVNKFLGGGEQTTEFFNLVTFDKRAEFMSKYFVKGSSVYAEGRLQYETYQSQRTGEMVTSPTITAYEVSFVEKKSSETAPLPTSALDGFEPMGENENGGFGGFGFNELPA